MHLDKNKYEIFFNTEANDQGSKLSFLSVYEDSQPSRQSCLEIIPLSHYFNMLVMTKYFLQIGGGGWYWIKQICANYMGAWSSGRISLAIRWCNSVCKFRLYHEVNNTIRNLIQLTRLVLWGFVSLKFDLGLLMNHMKLDIYILYIQIYCLFFMFNSQSYKELPYGKMHGQ